MAAYYFKTFVLARSYTILPSINFCCFLDIGLQNHQKFQNMLVQIHKSDPTSDLLVYTQWK